IRADHRGLVRALAGSIRASRRIADPARLLPAVLARTARSFRAFRLSLLRRRAGGELSLKELSMHAVLRVLLTLILVIPAGLLSYDLASYYLYSPWTRDARIRADVVAVAPDVSGYVDDIRVHNDQFVHKGDVLFTIDQERFKLALADAEAALEARHAQHLMLVDQYQRRSKLAPGYTITIEDLNNARRQSKTPPANYQKEMPSRDPAALNLNRTEVRASVNGFVTNLNLAKGTFASQGKPVMALIDSDSYRVEAYFEETKIPHI